MLSLPFPLNFWIIPFHPPEDGYRQIHTNNWLRKGGVIGINRQNTSLVFVLYNTNQLIFLPSE